VPENASRGAGLTRALALSWLVVAVSTGAHVVAHGAAPSVPAIAAIHGVVAFLLLPVSLAPFSLVRTFVAAFLAQGVVHVGLTLAAALGEATGSGALPHLAEHAGHGSATHMAVVASAGMPGHAVGGSVLPTPGMAAAHLVAALVLAVLLTRVEHAVTVCFVLSRPVRRAVVAAVLFAWSGLRPVARPGRPALAWGWEAAGLRDLWLSRCAAPRGPPGMCRPRCAVLAAC
jgi:hypothetical protein